MQTLSSTWMWIGGGLAGIVGALALGVSPTLLLAGASVLACPLLMCIGMRAMSGAQHTASTSCYSRPTVLKPLGAPEAVDATAKH
jgi:hypothetical protein